MSFVPLEQLAAGLEYIRRSPDDEGRIHLLVRRPGIGRREIVDVAHFDLETGMVGDHWLRRGSSSTPDGAAHPLAQVTITNWRGMQVLSPDPDEIPLAGDQIYADLNLSYDNLPAGSRLSLGTAVLEVTDKPHRGCAKFRARFGGPALRFVNTGEGKFLRLRGINARVVVAGSVRTGEAIHVDRSRSGSTGRATTDRATPADSSATSGG